MITTFAAQLPVTPVGKPVIITPVAPVVKYVMFVNPVLIHLVCASVPAADISVIVLFGLTVIVPVDVTTPQPPVKVTVKVKVPDTVGVPLMVTSLDAKVPETPDGNPATVAPVAPVVA
jgi:hypothetical protein